MELRQFKHKNVKHPNISSPPPQKKNVKNQPEKKTYAHLFLRNCVRCGHPFRRLGDTYIYGLYSEESGRVCIDANGLDSTHTWILTLSIESQDRQQIKLKVTTQ